MKTLPDSYFDRFEKAYVEAEEIFKGLEVNNVFVVRDTRSRFETDLWIGYDDISMNKALANIRHTYALTEALEEAELKLMPSPRPIKDPPITYNEAAFFIRLLSDNEPFEANKRRMGYLLKKHMPNSIEWDFPEEFINDYYDTNRKIVAEFILHSNAKQQIKDYIRMKWNIYDQ